MFNKIFRYKLIGSIYIFLIYYFLNKGAHKFFIFF